MGMGSVVAMKSNCSASLIANYYSHSSHRVLIVKVQLFYSIASGWSIEVKVWVRLLKMKKITSR